VLERAIGHTPRVAVEVSEWLGVQAGDVCMLCSDGLCGYVGDDEIAAAMRGRRAPQEQADLLVRLALERGGEDNVTVQVLRYGEQGGFLARRWIGRGALAAALAIAAAAIAGTGWFGVHADRSPGDDKPAVSPGSAAVATSAPAISPASETGAALTSPVATAAAIALPTPPARASVAAVPAATLESRVAVLERALQQNAQQRQANETRLSQDVAALREQFSALESRLGAAGASASNASNASGTWTGVPAASVAHKPAVASKPKKASKRPARTVAKSPANAEPAEEPAATTASSASTGASPAPVPAPAHAPAHETAHETGSENQPAENKQ
jgi:hypothetical protein